MRHFKYLLDQLKARGHNHTAIMYDIANVALGNLGSAVSDDACNIISSPAYRDIEADEYEAYVDANNERKLNGFEANM